jgi:hypothetical protein
MVSGNVGILLGGGEPAQIPHFKSVIIVISKEFITLFLGH